jgi:hypothetical protein
MYGAFLTPLSIIKLELATPVTYWRITPVAFTRSAQHDKDQLDSITLCAKNIASW